ncbi:MAG TPA: ABC transporter permease [Rhizomicrobium sp.]
MIGLAFAYLRRRWGQALLSILVGALGVAAVTVAFAGFDALPEAAERAWGGADLVVGPKGSALDLVLCCALHISDPRGLVSEKAAMAAVHQPLVRTAAPIALGDNVNGWRIVGTRPELLSIYHGDLARGRMWRRPLEAVLGAQAAKALHLSIGDTFVGAHGLALGGEIHSQFPYRVTGVLAPTGTVLDRLVLCDIESVRYIHRMHAEDDAAATGVTASYVNLPDAATAVIAAYRSPVAMMLIPRMVDADPLLSAGSPSLEIARLMGYARPIIYAGVALGLLLVLIAAAGAAAALMAAMNGRTRDLALLRALGATPFALAQVALVEALFIAIAATLLGFALAAGALAFGAMALNTQTGLVLAPHFDLSVLGEVACGAIAIALLSSLVPAGRAATTSIEDVLQS